MVCVLSMPTAGLPSLGDECQGGAEGASAEAEGAEEAGEREETASQPPGGLGLDTHTQTHTHTHTHTPLKGQAHLHTHAHTNTGECIVCTYFSFYNRHTHQYYIT